MKLRPGFKTAWNFPKRSTTQAFCCGTTATPWKAKTAAATNKINDTVSKPLMAISLPLNEIIWRFLFVPQQV